MTGQLILFATLLVITILSIVLVGRTPPRRRRARIRYSVASGRNPSGRRRSARRSPQRPRSGPAGGRPPGVAMMKDRGAMMRTLPRSLLPLLLTAATVHAGDEAGRTLYLRYCAACHGREGRGDGPVAPALGEKPTDLSEIAAAHGGEFPLQTVVEAIDGTRAVRAHGVSEMPVWGEVFRADQAAPLDQQIMTRGKVVVIASYLRALQALPRPSH